MRAIAVVGVCCVICINLALSGCAAAPPYRRETYVVRPQDTLYSIAWRHDLDFRDLAKWNDIGPDFRLQVGQVLLLQPEGWQADHPAARGGAGAAAGAGAGASRPPATGPASGAVPSAIAQPQTASRSQSIPRVGKPKPLADAPAGVAAQRGPAAGTDAATGGTPATAARPGGGVGSEVSGGAGGAGGGAAAGGAAGGSAVGAAGGALPAGRAASASGRAAAAGSAQWLWPTDYSAPPRPVPGGGILLFGRLGQDVRAAGAGRVVYTGSGIRGYGNLIIVKHGDNLLSSYAHNSEMLVHEGQDVGLGQIIARMGTASHQTSALYFEIRLNGKPVDPLRYLPVAR